MGKGNHGAMLGILAACGAAGAIYRWHYRMPMKEYTRSALYMAALDDEICRNELEGNRIGGETIVFPPRAETLQERYYLFLRMNRKKYRAALRAEIEAMEQRLLESRQYIRQPKVDLEVGWKGEEDT